MRRSLSFRSRRPLRPPFRVHFPLWALALAALLPAGPAGAAPHRAAAGEFVLNRDNGTPLVEVRFSDTRTGLFAIDTGAYDCIMTAACAKRLGYKQDANPLFLRELLAGSALAAPATVKVPSLEVARLRVTDLTFQVCPSGTLGADNGRPIDGLIGGTLLSHFALLLDYPRRTLVWISPGGLSDQAVAELGMDPKAGIGLHQELGPVAGFKVNHYSAPVRLRSGVRERGEEMYLDTGASSSSISADAARRLGLVPTGTVPYQFVFQAPDLACRADVPEFRIGPQSFSNVSVIYPSHRDARMVSLIGENVLGGCRVLLDFGPHRCFLQPVLPGLAPGPLPPMDTGKVDWERLRNAPDPPGFPDLIRALTAPESLERLGARLARPWAAPADRAGADQMDGSRSAAARAEEAGLLLRQAGDGAGAAAAFDRAVALRRAEARARPEDAARAAALTDALVLAGKAEEALTGAQADAAQGDGLPGAWRALGRAREGLAASLLLGEWGRSVSDGQALAPIPDIRLLPDRPDPARARRIADLRGRARESYGRAVALAPEYPEGYRARARFWLLDGWLLSLLHALDVKGQSPPQDSALAGMLADYQAEARLRPDDVDVLRRVALLDAALPLFHDGNWLRENLHAAGQGLGVKNAGLLTAETAQARLLALSRGGDPARAASALAALGEAQSARDDPRAEATLRRALAADPARPGPLAALASRLVAEGRLGDLRDLLTPLAARADASAVRLLLSAALTALGEARPAEDQARAALKVLPDSPAANLALAGLLLARSGYDFDVLTEVSACLSRAEAGLGGRGTPAQRASLQTMRAVWLAQARDPAGARLQLIALLRDQPTCTQAREALSAMAVPPAAP